MENRIIDAVIPVYKPGGELGELIRKLELQQVRIRTIYLVHTKDGKDLMHSEIIKGYDNIVIEEIEPEDFDHGGTRDAAIRKSDADYVLFMTQDAVPADRRLTERLLESMEDRKVAMAYARQLPKRDCGLIEQHIRRFNYPDKSVVKTKADLKTMGIKTYFCSDVCAMYDRELYVKRGGFVKPAILNEDMIYAAGCIEDGYKIAYVAEARVVHSHNYTNKQQFRRNFDVAVSQAQHPEIFQNVSSESEGILMLKSTAFYLIKRGHPLMLVSLLLSCSAKYLGFLMGKRYSRLPQILVRKCTMNPRYWENHKKSGEKY